MHAFQLVSPTQNRVRCNRARVELERLARLCHRFVKLARQKQYVRNRRCDHSRLRRDLARAFDFRVRLVVPPHRRQAVRIPAMRYLIARLQLNRLAQLALSAHPVAVVVQFHKTQRRMPLRQTRINFNRTHRRFPGAFPRFGRRWFDVPVQQCITIRELCVRNRILRIEFNCTFEPFDGLAQTLRRASGRVVTSGCVKLASFFIFARLRVHRGHQYLRRDRGNTILLPSLFRRRFFRELAIHRGMAQVAQDSFKRRLTAQRIKLWLDSQPDYPAVSDRVSLQK